MSADLLTASPADIRRALALLCVPREVYELRALGTGKGTISGYYDDLGALARDAALCSQKFERKGIYFALNPVRRDLLARSCNGVCTYAKHTTSDADVLTRRWLPIDFDPVRPAGISSTDEKHTAALDRARRVREYLTERGWVAPILADSGNGGHLLFRIDLPNDADSSALIKRVLKGLGAFFDDENVSVDQTTYNAARIWKLYGTPARKGDSLPERPHRLSRILEAPESLEVVKREQLEQIAALLPEPERSTPTGNARLSQPFDLARWITEHGIEVARESTWNGGRRWILRHCLFDSSHGGSGAAILQLSSGAIVYRCLHNSCADREWTDVRELFEPGYRNRRASALVPNGKQMPTTTASTSQTAEVGVTTRLSEVEPEEVEWLWRDRLALGKLNLLVGDPGNGKSFVTLDTAARVSTGAEFPDGSPCVRGSVILITGEDGIADTVRPRLDAQGSDLTKIHQLKIKSGDSERQFHIGAHLDQLRVKIREIADVRLLIIDPLTAYLGDVDPNKDSRVRGLLTPFATLAEEMRVAILAVMHLNKAAVMDAIYRRQRSIYRPSALGLGCIA
jgi:AAA domain-containing protein